MNQRDLFGGADHVPPARKAPARRRNTDKQAMLFSGLDCLPGQQDLFADIDAPRDDRRRLLVEGTEYEGRHGELVEVQRGPEGDVRLYEHSTTKQQAWIGASGQMLEWRPRDGRQGCRMINPWTWRDAEFHLAPLFDGEPTE